MSSLSRFEPRVPCSSPLSEAGADTERTRVLIVEDSPTQAQALRLILESEGFEVQAATHADAALQQLQTQAFDILISDIVMPGRTGYDLCREVKADPRTRTLPVILLTTLSDPMDIIQGLEAGADNFLTKPYEPEILVKRIYTILENKRLRIEGQLKVGVEILFMGRKFVVSSDKEQILDLLVSTFEDVVHTNRELRNNQAELAEAKAKLEDYAQRLESRVRTSEEHFRTLVESMDDMVFTLDTQQRYTGVFGSWLRTDGQSAGRYLGKTPREVFGDEAAGVHETAYRSALAGNRVSYEWSFGNERGRHFQTSLSPLNGDSGDIVGLVGVCRDVTEQKKLESQIMVSDRMASVGMLAAGVAHEINNPLASVMANVELAMREVAQLEARIGPLGELAEELRDAREAAERVRQIVKDLRIFSRAEQEERGPVDVERVMESTLRMAWNEIRHRAHLVRHYERVPPVDANESRLGQVFLNLVVNAAQAIAEGDADRNEIRVSTRQDEQRRVITEVSDTGPGIPPEVMRHLFSPFVTTKPPGVGTGLGLSICHRLITGLGGEISVDSEPNRGTTFTITLPPARVPLETRGESCEAAVPSSARRGRVLVVDDEPLVGQTIRRGLRTEHDVSVVQRARDAFALVTDGARFDVILCDLMMPDLTGMDLYAELLQTAPEQAERMVFLTGGAFTPRARQFLDQVENHRVEKPFDMTHLRAIVKDRVR